MTLTKNLIIKKAKAITIANKAKLKNSHFSFTFTFIGLDKYLII